MSQDDVGAMGVSAKTRWWQVAWSMRGKHAQRVCSQWIVIAARLVAIDEAGSVVEAG